MAEPPGEGDFLQVIERCTEAITLNRNNHLLFSNRSAAYSRVGKFREALDDAKRCHELKPDWPKSYYRLGVAYQGLERHEEAMVAFAEGLAVDPEQAPMLYGLTESMLKSKYKGNFQPKLEKFESLKLDKNPFIITSVIGQELQLANKLEYAVRILEAASAIGTDSLKLKASLMQALGHVHWLLGNTDKALGYMEKDLKICETLGDKVGCCRARDNLGIAYCQLQRYEEAIAHHHEQFSLAHQRGDTLEVYNALTRMGSAYQKLGNFAEAIKAYKDSLKIAKEVGDQTLITRGFSNYGCALMESGDVDRAILWHHQHLNFAKETKSKEEEAEAYGHLGHACYVKGNYEQSMMFYQQLLSVAVQLSSMTLKARAYGGMGLANLAMNNLWHAQSCREQQLKLCRDIGDEEGELTALSHLGEIHKASGKLAQATQCYSDSLTLAQKLKDRPAEGRAFANLGSCQVALGNYKDAVGYFTRELIISQETNNKAREATTLGHLGTAFLALDDHEQALEHLRQSLHLAREIKERSVECQALSNLGSFHTTNKEFRQALPHLENALKLAQALKDHATESKVCHNLGLCHEALGNHQHAIQYYQHDFLVAKENQDKDGMTKSCEKLMKTHMEIGDREQAEIYQKKLHAIAEEIQNSSGKCTFWNQIAEDALDSGYFDKAIEYYENLLKEAKKEQHQMFESLAYSGLGNAYLSRGDYEHALSYFRRDLNIRKGTGDVAGECMAYGNMGAAYNSLAQHQQSIDCYDHQLALAKQLENPALMTKAFGCLGVVHRNMKDLQKALQYHQQQLSSALTLKDNTPEQVSAYANLGDSYEAIGDYAQAVKHHDQQLMLAQRDKNEMMQIRALSSLGRAHRGLGNLRRSLFFFEQQLKLARNIGDEYIEAECYADKGSLQMIIGEYQAALESFSSQLQLSKSLQDAFSEALAACGLGEVHFQLGNHRESIDYHKLDWRISSANRFIDGEARALGNIAETYESIGEYKSAIEYREKQLSAADQLQDSFTKAVAFTGLGKIYIKMSDYNRAITLLKQALTLVVEQTPQAQEELLTQTKIEAEAKIRFYLGQAFYYQCQFEAALVYLQKALPLYEHMRHNVGHYDHATKQTLSQCSILFQTLINTLVKQNKVEQALEMAEMERNRAVSDALMHREVNRQTLKDCGLMKQYTPHSSWIQEAVDTIQSPVLYFSVALNHVFIWLLHPKSGIVQFQKVDMTDFDHSGSDTASVYSESSSSYIQPLIEIVASVRESLGIEASSGISDDFDSEDNESLLGSNSSLPNTPAGGSLLSGSLEVPHGKGTKAINMQPVHELYDILVRPVEYALPKQRKGCAGLSGKLIIVPDKHLYLVPFALLKAEGTSECLYERYRLQFAPSLQSLVLSKQRGARGQMRNGSPVSPSRSDSKRTKSPGSESLVSNSEVPPRSAGDFTEPLIVANPAIPAGIGGWQSLKGIEKEAKLIADLLHVTPIIGSKASKERLVRKLPKAESVHFASNVSWNRCEILLAPPDNAASDSEDSEQGGRSSAGAKGGRGRGEGDKAMNGLPDPTQYVLSVSEIMSMKLSAKMVVLSGAHKSDSPRMSYKGLMSVAQAFLCAGVDCVLVPLWTSSYQASRLMMNAFYSSLIYGSRTSRALRYAMQVVHTSSKYGHPTNWAGYMLVGRDIVLRDRSVELAQSVQMMVQAPLDHLLSALRTLQAMLVNSMKHIFQSEGSEEPKYTSRRGIESKVGSVQGWEELLTCIGFQFIGAMKEVPATIVFPEHDDSGLQRKAHKHLEALLGIPAQSLKALSTLSKFPNVAKGMLTALQNAKVLLESPNGIDQGVHVKLDKSIWATSGCKEFFRHLNFELSNHLETHSDKVTISAPAMKLERKMLYFAATAITAVFDPDQLPLAKIKETILDVLEDWYCLAVQLDISYTVRKDIERDNSSNEGRFQAMLEDWVRRTSPPPSWGSLVRALRSPTIARGDIARKIEAEQDKSSSDDISPIRLSDKQAPLNVDEHLKNLLEATWDAREKWQVLGVELGMRPGALEAIRFDFKNRPSRCYIAALEHWLTQTSVPNVAGLIKVLQSPTIDCGDIAKNVEDMLNLSDVSISERLEILLHPVDQIGCKPGSQVQFSVSATANAARFQWYFHGNVIDADNSDYTGATERTLIILECLSVHQGQYKCVITDRQGQTSADSNTASFVLGGTKISKPESILLQRVLRIDQTESTACVQELLEKDVTYEELEVLFGRDQKTNHLSKNLKEKLEQRVEEEQLYQEAMAYGKSVPLLYLKVLAIGPGQVGKTTFLKRLLGQMQWDIDTATQESQPLGSTGQAEIQIVHIEYSKRTVAIDLSLSKWDVIEESKFEKHISSLITLLKEPQSRTSGSSAGISESCTHAVATVKENNSIDFDETTESDSRPEPVDEEDDRSESKEASEYISVSDDDEHEVQDHVEQPLSDDPKSMNQAIVLFPLQPPEKRSQSSSASQEPSKIDKVLFEFGKRLDGSMLVDRTIVNLDAIINLADIGGQPAFLEMLPSLTVGPAMYLVFMKIIEGLKTPYPVRFRCEGSKTSTKYKEYTYTSEEVIFTALSSIACFGNSDQDVEQYVSDKTSLKSTNSLALLMGTFADALKDSEEDSELQQDKVSKMEHQLNQQLTETDFYKDDLIAFSDSTKGEVLFRINNKSGGEGEVKKYKKLLETFMEQKFKKFNIPTSWLMFSICIKILALHEGKHAVSFEDCVEIGEHLNMSKQMVTVALQFLHKYIGLVMFFPGNEHLKNIVICDPQAVFSSISEIIFNVYDPEKRTISDSKYTQFVEKGQFSIEDIKLDTKKGRNLLPVDTLVNLLVHLNIAVPIPNSSTYFLPAVLQTASVDSLVLDTASENPEPLCVTFRTGYLPLGFVCALVANLISECNFELLGKEQGEVIHRNKVMFRFRGIYDIEVISWPKYCEFRVSRCSSITEEFHSRESCPLIRKTIIKSIDHVIGVMRQSSMFRLSKDYQLAFRCPDAKHSATIEGLGHEPMAVIVGENLDDPQTITCVKCKKSNFLSPTMVLWFREALTITKQPRASAEGAHIPYGGDLTLSLSASGVQPLSYQWNKDGKQLKSCPSYHGCTSPNLHIEGNQGCLKGAYWCEVKDKYGSALCSDEIIVTVELEFSADMTCDDLCDWLKQNKLSDKDILPFRRQEICGESFLELSSSSDFELLLELKCAFTFGAKTKLKKLMASICTGPSAVVTERLKKLTLIKDFWDLRAHWKDLALELNITVGDCEAFDAKHRGNPDDCFQAILLMWLQGQPEPEIAVLLSALQSAVIDRNDLVEVVKSSIDQIAW